MDDKERSLSERVHEVMKHALFKRIEAPDGVPPPEALMVEGIRRKFGFHRERLAEKKDEVKAILNEMPAKFHKNSGGGWSFLNLCFDKHDNHWAEHPIMEELVVLAIALGMGKYCLPRDMWNFMPGGVPYVMFDTTQS